MSFKESLKYAFSRYFRLPVKGDDAELAKQGLPRRELKNLGTDCANDKLGPIVIFFEVRIWRGIFILRLFFSLDRDVSPMAKAYSS